MSTNKETGVCNCCNGKIKIYSPSPYEIIDNETQIWLSQLQPLWNSCKKSDSVQLFLTGFFSKSKNPFISALKLMATCGDFHKAKQNSLAHFIMEVFSHWCKIFYQSYSSLTEKIKRDAFDLVSRQKNHLLAKLAAKTYKMKESKHLFVQPIRQMALEAKYKEACAWATLLELHYQFQLQEFVMPLLFQNKHFDVVENFLKGSKRHQIDLIKFLDNYVGQRNSSVDAQSLKCLTKFMMKMVETHKISMSTCPKLSLKKDFQVLNFLMKKRFVEKSIGCEAWKEMVLEVVGSNQKLQLELVSCLARRGTIQEALMWANKFNIPKSDWPKTLVLSVERVEGNVWDEEKNIWNYHRLAIDESQIIFVDADERFSAFMKDIVNEKMVGLDFEWKPSFDSKQSPVSIIQVATRSRVYLLDVISLNSKSSDLIWLDFVDLLLSNAKITKLAFGAVTDFSTLRKTFAGKFKNRIVPKGLLDLNLLWKRLNDVQGFVFPFASSVPSTESRGLTKLVQICLGKKLDKSDQFSNWENRPLRRKQILYAALDAYCLIEVYDVICNQAKIQKVPLEPIISKLEKMEMEKKEKKEGNAAGKKKKGAKPTVEKPEAAESMQGRNDRKPVSLMKFRFICDAGLHLLARELRKFGVDTFMVNKNGSVDEENLKNSDLPVVLLTLKNRNNVKKLIPNGEIVRLTPSNFKKQLAELLKLLPGILPDKEKYYSRCLECNGKKFRKVTRENMLKEIEERKTSVLKQINWVDATGYNDPFQFSSQGKSNDSRKNFPILLEGIKPDVLKEISLFYVCTFCGTCFWEESDPAGKFAGFRGEP